MSVITKEYFENTENQRRASQLSLEIAICLAQTIGRTGNNIPLSAYLLHKASQYKSPSGVTFQCIINGTIAMDEAIRSLAKEKLSAECWDILLQLTTKYTSEEFALAAVIPVSENETKDVMATPDSIIKLAHKLMNVHSDECVADICCGTGSYLVSAAFEEKQATYTGYEIDVENSAIAMIRAELVTTNAQVNLCDAFSLVDTTPSIKFDKIFANYPFGLKLKNLGGGEKYLEKLIERYPELSKATSSDWVFNALLCDLLTETGKAIGIMTNGSTWNSIDTPIRKYFVEQKMVECVISLPNRMFSSTNISTTLIVLSHNNNTIRMIDATKIFQRGRRQNEFSPQDIDAIIALLHSDSDCSKAVSIEEVRSNDYNLSLSRYIKDNISFSNGVPFESIIKKITRGAPCTANQLDEMVSHEVTNMQYLMLANIQNGIIDDTLPYLSNIDPKYEKYCLKNNNLILSKNGYPYKVAVASVQEEQRILANGNLYIIELDEEMADPYYMKAFFDSERGIEVLKSITVGATIPNIGVDKLKKVEIPLPSLSEQKSIAQRYQVALEEIATIRSQLEKAVDELRYIFDGGM